MMSPIRITLAVATMLLATYPATAARHARAHPPIHVATPAPPSSITPYVFPYGGHYRYNSPGPVYFHLAVWSPYEGCRLWRYNYLYWTCG
jgi:hypothetical protein